MSEESPRRVDKIQGEIVHVYDGIEEADNELPTWWLMTFYGAIAFSMLYWVVYHELHAAELPAEEYASALAGRVGDGEVSAEFLVALRDDPGAVSNGDELFQQNCAVCHLSRGEGNIGPNLTDPNWLHGGDPTDIYSSIYDGRLQNGMPAWGATLGTQAVQRIAAYVLSIRDTNVEGKVAEGEIWVPGVDVGQDASGEEGGEEGAEEGAGESEEGVEDATQDHGAEPSEAVEEGPADEEVSAEEAALDEGATDAPGQEAPTVP